MVRMRYHSSAAMPPKPRSLSGLLRPAAPVALLLFAGTAVAAPGTGTPSVRMPNLPLTFERNTGRYPKDVQFVARSGQGTLFLTRREAVVSIRKGDRASALRLKLQGSAPNAAASGLDKQPGIVNYLLGKDPAKWRTNIPTYSRVKLAGVYPGIDLVYYGAGKGRTLEYDFVVKPGGDPSIIRMAVSGAKSIRAVGGGLIASTACGDVTLNRPYAYQTVGGIRKQVACSFTLERDTVAFRVARYDTSRPLVVDPTLAYSTMVGGVSSDVAYGIAVDATGAATVCGGTGGTAFPTTAAGAYQTAYVGGVEDAFVTKLNAAGTALQYSTFLGGSYSENAQGIALDATGAATVTGSTGSANFPTTTGAYQTSHAGSIDAFVTKLNATGTALVYSTLLGSTGDEYARGLALDASGAVTVCGDSTAPVIIYDARGPGTARWNAPSAVFPTTSGAFQTANAGGADAFVTKLNATGTALVYSTYLGGTSTDQAIAIAVDAAGAATVCGQTKSLAFPTSSGAYQTARAGGFDAFVTKLNATGTALEYSTYLGSTSSDCAYGVALDAAGAATVCGSTSGSTFPTTSGAYQTAHGLDGGSNDAFVTKLNTAGTALAYSTFLPGDAGDDCANAIALDATGAVLVCGYSRGRFPTTADAYQAGLAGSNDAFVARLDATCATLTYSTYLGTNLADYARAIAMDAAGAVYVGGDTSNTFPTTVGAYQTAAGGSNDAWVAKFSFAAGTAAGTAMSADPVTCYASETITLTGTLTKSSDSSAVAGKGIQFKIDAGGTWTDAAASTGADGKATLSVTAPATTGAHTIYVRFQGDADYTASDGSNTLTVNAADATTLVADDASAAPGAAVTVSATLTKTTGGTAISGLQLQFRIGDAGSWTDAAALTDASGKASASLTAPATAGSYTINAQYVGGAHYAASTDSATLTVSAPVPTLAVDSGTASAGSRTTLRCRLTDAAGAGIGGQRLQFSIDSGAWVDAEILTTAAGYATLTITAPAAGTHTLQCRFEAAGGYSAATGSGTLTTTALVATATAVYDRTAGPGDAVSLLAYLQLQSKAGVAGKQLEFQFNGGAWTPASAATEATGKASLTVTAPVTAGTYVINARFLGDATHTASAGTANLTVAGKRSVYVYTINRSGKVGAPGTLVAYFYWYQKNGTLTPVSGKSLRFVCAGVSLDSTVTTDASGKATVSVTPATAGSHPFTVAFTADADYNAGSAGATFAVAP